MLTGQARIKEYHEMKREGNNGRGKGARNEARLILTIESIEVDNLELRVFLDKKNDHV